MPHQARLDARPKGGSLGYGWGVHETQHIASADAGAAHGARLCCDELVRADVKLKTGSKLLQAFAVSNLESGC